MIDIAEYTNSELEEMGLPVPHDCIEMERDFDDRGNAYDVCVECRFGILLPGVLSW